MWSWRYVLQAGSGNAALRLWNENRDKIHLVLTDIVMPDGMTGHELAEKVLADRPRLKVVYTSGYNNELSQPNPKLVEGVNFLQKPYTPRRLARILRKNLDAG